MESSEFNAEQVAKGESSFIQKDSCQILLLYTNYVVVVVGGGRGGKGAGPWSKRRQI
jgi:hypothetical protein